MISMYRFLSYLNIYKQVLFPLHLHSCILNTVYVYVYICVCMLVIKYGGTVTQLLALPPHSKTVMGSIPAWGAVGSGGPVLPRPSVLRWAISRAFLCGVCMFSPFSSNNTSEL